MIKLFSKVKCKGYLKKDFKYVYPSGEDETIEDKKNIRLGYGKSVTQNIYKLIEKEFNGIVVGIMKKNSKRDFEEVYYCEYSSSEIITHPHNKIEVAKVYYENNRSRLVPLEYIENIEE